jgi:DNA-binding beta-propeller fold protein YncE
LEVPLPPTGIAAAPDGSAFYVTGAGVESQVYVIDGALSKVVDVIPVGHTALAPVVSGDGKTLWVCNRFQNDVSQIDLAAKREVRRMPARREPVAAALTRDGKFLLVANFLPAGRADVDLVAAVISVLNTSDGSLAKELILPNGSASLEDIAISPDGKYAVVTHILSRYPLPTTQLERGWMNTNAKTLIDLERMEILNTVLLDNVDGGAANPWGIAWAADGSILAVAHAGTHEISLIQFPALLAKLAKIPAKLDKTPAGDDPYATHVQADVPNDLAFLVGVRQRIRLSASDRGPRAVTMAGTRVVAANYFTGTLSVVDLKDASHTVVSIPLGPGKPMSQVRQGEFYFHDASICFQGWQTCATCHPGEGRVDALNWDLLNDGLGNPKNTKSLLLAHRTPPAMSLGIRDTAETAVRSGIKGILFSAQPEEVPVAIDVYLKSLQPVPSPFLVKGRLSPAAENGRKIFQASGCAECHPDGLFTDLNPYDVGTQGPNDKPSDRFDTPSLVEIWRTAPYLHDGSAATLQEVVTLKNPKDRHGKTSHLTSKEIEELCAYLSSL